MILKSYRDHDQDFYLYSKENETKNETNQGSEFYTSLRLTQERESCVLQSQDQDKSKALVNQRNFLVLILLVVITNNQWKYVNNNPNHFHM